MVLASEPVGGRSQGTELPCFILFSVLFLSFIHVFLPACGHKTDYIIIMALWKTISSSLFFKILQETWSGF